jgi:Icc-related predicted phosphoesterase
MKKHFANRLLILLIFASLGLSLIFGTQPPNTSEHQLNPAQQGYQDLTIKKFTPSQGIINSSNRNIVYFVQLSDIHVEIEEPHTLSNFDKFCNETISVVNPAFIMATGDLVEAQDLPKGQHEQDVREYEVINNTISKYNLRDRFFATIGNHEMYQSKNRSLFTEYIYPNTQYQIQMNTSFGVYQFIVIDDVKEIGMKNPFNLWGEMKKDKLNNLERHINAPGDFNQTLLFTHIPILHTRSEKSDSGKTFRDLIDESGAPAIFTGHVHVRPIYAKPDTVFDLMVPAFGKKLSYRIISIDNDIYSFSEETMGEYPTVTITTPTDSRFYSPNTRVDRLIQQNEIRVLIFDPKSVLSTEVYIDGKFLGNLTYAGNNLWVLPYNQQEYSTGAHELSVVVKTESGEVVRSHSFNLNDTRPTSISGIYKYINGFAIETSLWVIIILISVISVVNIVVGPIWKRISPETFAKYNLKTFDKEHNLLKRMFVKNHIKAGNLDLKDTLLLLLPTVYVFIGPIFVAPLYFNEWGVLWFNRMTLGTNYTISMYGLLFPFLLLWGFVNLQNYVIRNFRNTKRNARGGLIFQGVMIIAYTAVVGIYFPVWVLFANPMFYLTVLLTVYFVYLVEIRKYN